MRPRSTPAHGRGRASIRAARTVLSVAFALVLTLATGAGADASGVIGHGSRERPWVALTFDDGWGASACERIVSVLRAKGATATFFINGSIVRGSPSRWRAILRGFPVANHTRTHAWLTRISSAAIRTEIATNERVHEQVLGRPMLPILRPPYGAYDGRVLRIADGLGYRTLLWDTSGGDTSRGATTGSVIRNATRGRNGSIVLLHCGPAMTPAAVGPIVDSYRSRGYELVGLDRMLGLVPPSPTACRVRNLDTDIVKDSLQAAVTAARPGQRLTVRGTCRGRTTVDRALSIRGVEREGSGPPTLVGSGTGRVLSVPAGVSVTLHSLVLRHGDGVSLGGCIRNAGTMLLTDVTVHHCHATDRGGGIHNVGSLGLAGTTVIRGDRADHGGGIWNAGDLTMTEGATITANTADTAGGGIWSSGTLNGVRCALEADPNVLDNAPDDCVLAGQPAP